MMLVCMRCFFLGVRLGECSIPTFSPRGRLDQRAPATGSFLPLYYLAAITVVYCSGYFLLVPVPPRSSPGNVRPCWKRIAEISPWH